MRKYLLISFLLLLGLPSWGEEPLKVFQFPRNAIPRIDGDFSDWDIVPDSYAIGIDRMQEDNGYYAAPDRKNLDITVKVGWVKGENRLYFLYEATDDHWDFETLGLKGDVFELVVDGDRSGGPHIARFREDPEHVSEMESYFSFQNVHAQNYHIFTPPAKGQSWTMVWGPQQWLKDFPWANVAYDYAFSHGEGGILRMEFWVTPFDKANPAGPEKSVPSVLTEGKTIGLCWAVIDFDGGEKNNGFWNLSPHHKMYGDASLEREFVLCPLEPAFQDKLTAAWDHYVVPGTRTVRFEDRSEGAIDTWHWDFGDGTTSSERNPFHTYAQDGVQYTVTLTVSGPEGSRRCSKVWDVGVWGYGKTDYSLFARSDSLQVPEIVAVENPVMYRLVGHHGPAVEDAGVAYRVYFNDSGAIDLYSKSGEQMELRKYLWYPTEEQQANEGAGCDEYLVGKTVGLGGFALWDGKQEVKLVATKGRTARAGKTAEGSFAEMVSYGVPCGKKLYDISLRIDVFDASRVAKVTVRELNGKKLRFLTGVNFHPGESVTVGDGFAAVWGVHPSDVSQNPQPLGAAVLFDPSLFPSVTRTESMVQLVSKPAPSASVSVTAASTKEKGIDTEERLLAFIRSLTEK